ncbi:MAG TPA: hypothetical protein ENJ27_01755 [Candidatus Moranbacteria bacterium]|nr:hypothetical protein [Candidatus Moranbacteria bacterium]
MQTIQQRIAAAEEALSTEKARADELRKINEHHGYLINPILEELKELRSRNFKLMQKLEDAQYMIRNKEEDLRNLRNQLNLDTIAHFEKQTKGALQELKKEETEMFFRRALRGTPLKLTRISIVDGRPSPIAILQPKESPELGFLVYLRQNGTTRWRISVGNLNDIPLVCICRSCHSRKTRLELVRVVESMCWKKGVKHLFVRYAKRWPFDDTEDFEVSEGSDFNCYSKPLKGVKTTFY